MTGNSAGDALAVVAFFGLAFFVWRLISGPSKRPDLTGPPDTTGEPPKTLPDDYVS
jgi:hypothetical protein